MDYLYRELQKLIILIIIMLFFFSTHHVLGFLDVPSAMVFCPDKKAGFINILSIYMDTLLNLRL